MQEVETLGNMDLIILCLNPRELIHNFISPLVKTFVADVHLRIQYPQEAKALAREHADWNVHDL